MKKISIITPCFNAENYIAETVQSVVNQSAVLSGRVELEYIICDGGSTDGTVALARQTADRNGNDSVTILSERDSGMYDALSKGLSLATGDVCAYINAGDYYNRHAFDVVFDVIEAHDIQWLTGMTVVCNEQSQIVNASLPCCYRRYFIRSGLYGLSLPFIQQESTFWKRALNETLNLGTLRSYRYAGDYYIWHQFAQHETLVTVEAHLGTFRIHPGQISEASTKYFQEMASFCGTPGILNRLLSQVDKFLWRMPKNAVSWLRLNRIIRYNHGSQAWEWTEF